MSTDPKITQDKPRLSILDALLLAPLAAPFLLPPIGLLGWVGYRIGAGYVAALQTPAAPASWWQWPWGWPGARLVEAIHGALGLWPASDFSFSNPLRLIADLAAIDRSIPHGISRQRNHRIHSLVLGCVADRCRCENLPLGSRKEASMTDALRPTS